MLSNFKGWKRYHTEKREWDGVRPSNGFGVRTARRQVTAVHTHKWNETKWMNKKINKPQAIWIRSPMRRYRLKWTPNWYFNVLLHLCCGSGSETERTTTIWLLLLRLLFFCFVTSPINSFTIVDVAVSALLFWPCLYTVCTPLPRRYRSCHYLLFDCAVSCLLLYAHQSL